MNSLRDIVRFRDLVYMLTWRDVCVRYKQSILGVLWAILIPSVIVSAGVVVKLALAEVSGIELTSRDLALVAVKAVPWSFLVAAIRLCTNCLVSNANLVTKVRFPKVILPVSAILSQLFDFLIASFVLIIILICLGINFSWVIIWVPVLLVLLVALAAGLGIFLAAACLFFRDVKHLVEVLLTFGIFVTPVFYEVSVFKGWGYFLMLNPASPILEGFAAVVVDQRSPDLPWLGYSTAVAMLVLSGALGFFRRSEPAFAECM